MKLAAIIVGLNSLFFLGGLYLGLVAAGAEIRWPWSSDPHGPVDGES